MRIELRPPVEGDVRPRLEPDRPGADYPGSDWARFDISPGSIRRRRPDYAFDQGGTGYGVRLITDLAEGYA